MYLNARARIDLSDQGNRGGQGDSGGPSLFCRRGLLAEEGGDLRALLFDLVEIQAEVGAVVDEVVDVREGFVPIAADNVDWRFATVVAGGGGSSAFKEGFDDLGAAHKGGDVKRRVTVAVGFLGVGLLSEEKVDDFWVTVEGGAGEGSHAVFLMSSVDGSAEFEVSLDPCEASAGDGIFEEVSELVGVTVEGFENVRGFVGDVEDEVVAEEAVGILDLEKVESVWWEGVEFNGDGFVLAGRDGGGDAASVDDDMGVIGHVAGVEGHGFFAIGEDRKMLSAGLCVERAEGPESGLGEGEARSRTVAGGEGGDELSFFYEGEELGAGEALAVAIDLEVVVVLELKGEGFLVEEGIDLKDDGAFGGGGFEGGEKVPGKGGIDGILIEAELPGERSGVAGAPFENHFPNGIEAWFASPGESPEVFFGDAFFGDVAVEFEVDDVESALGKNEEAVIGSAPGGGVHAAAGRVGADPEGHAVAVAANVGLGFAFVVAFEVEEFEAVFGPFRKDVGISAFLGRREGNVEEETGEVIALGG